MRGILRGLRDRALAFLALGREIADLKVLIGTSMARQVAARGALEDIRDAEFKVFSQFGEDGILQYLIARAGVPRELHTFVEFGVESYAEANTRFLLLKDNWRGLIIDSDARYMRAVREGPLAWRHDLTAVTAFIDADNINGLIRDAGFAGAIGLLSIDIDGNDYWVWSKLDVVDPIIVVAEYNSVLGPAAAVSVPYDPAFVRSKAHHSTLYWGCSLGALAHVGRRKGYALVGCNSAGNNAFFVRRDKLDGLRELTVREAYVESRFRESRDRSGRLTFLSGAERRAAIADMALVDVESGAMLTVRDLAVT
jgi:hypothetical protein